MAVGIMGLDLGVTTGVAWGVWNPALRDQVGLWTALARGKKMGAGQIHSEDMLELGHALGEACMTKIAEWNMNGLSKQDILICIEDFQARPNQVRGGKAQDKLAPVFLAGVVSEHLRAANWHTCIRMYDPSLTKSKAPDKRLKLWAYHCRPQGKMGWIKGKQHARDACRLVATGLEKVV